MKNTKFLTISVFAAIMLLVFLGLATAPASVFAQQGTQVATASAGAGGDAALVARGKYIVQFSCADCHRAYDLATDKGTPLAGGNEFDLGPLGTYYSANLTILQSWTTDDFKKVLHQGRDPKTDRVISPIMPYTTSYHGMADDDVAAIAAYLKSLTPVKHDIPDEKPGPAAANLPKLDPVSVTAPTRDSSAEYGRYLVENVAACGDCHNPRDAQSAFIKGKEFGGGSINLGTSDQPLYASPITGPVLLAEGYTKENFRTALRSGFRPWGAQIPTQMPWKDYSIMTDNDVDAIWSFLQTKKVDSPFAPLGTPSASSDIGFSRATAAPTSAASSSSSAATAAPTTSK